MKKSENSKGVVQETGIKEMDVIHKHLAILEMVDENFKKKRVRNKKLEEIVRIMKRGEQFTFLTDTDKIKILRLFLRASLGPGPLLIMISSLLEPEVTEKALSQYVKKNGLVLGT